MLATQPQHLEALERANRTRFARSALKKAIGAGELTVPRFLVTRHSEPEFENMPVAQVIRAQRRWGKTRTRKFMGRIDLSPLKTVGALTDRQRLLICRELLGGSDA